MSKLEYETFEFKGLPWLEKLLNDNQPVEWKMFEAYDKTWVIIATEVEE